MCSAPTCHVRNVRPSINSSHRAEIPRNMSEYQCLWFQFFGASNFYCMVTSAELSLSSGPPLATDWAVIVVAAVSETTKHAPLSVNGGTDDNDTTISLEIGGRGGWLGRQRRQQRRLADAATNGRLQHDNNRRWVRL